VIAVDTNLLIYAHRAALPEHRDAQRALEQASRDTEGWGIPAPCIAEFWAVVTHPKCVGGPSPARSARSFIAALARDGGAKLWVPGEGFGMRLSQLAQDLGVQGVRIFDLQIALSAFDNGATEIWTHDRHFNTCPGCAS